MAFSLYVPIGYSRFIPLEKGGALTYVLAPVPKAKMVVEDVLTGARSLHLCRIPKYVMRAPEPLRTLAVGETDAWHVVQRINSVVYHPPHLTTTSSGNPAEIQQKSGGNPPDIHWILINSLQNN